MADGRRRGAADPNVRRVTNAGGHRITPRYYEAQDPSGLIAAPAVLVGLGQFEIIRGDGILTAAPARLAATGSITIWLTVDPAVTEWAPVTEDEATWTLVSPTETEWAPK